MIFVQSFKPIISKTGKILILGSMPGRASLEAGEYYAHKRNAFWQIMGELTGAYPDLAYKKRIEKMTGAGISLWDVLKSCNRPGSLDSAITDEEINDFTEFFAKNKHIHHILFNGTKAEQSFRRYILNKINKDLFSFQRLPSTSPANASMNFETKLKVWKETFLYLSDTSDIQKP